jgi:hypothetical protein
MASRGCKARYRPPPRAIAGTISADFGGRRAGGDARRRKEVAYAPRGRVLAGGILHGASERDARYGPWL